MERLTYKAQGNCGFVWEARCPGASMQDVIGRLAAYEDTGLAPEEIKAVQDAMTPIPFSRYREIMEAEKDGRLVVLPCKVGDTVYTIEENYFDCTACKHGADARYSKDIGLICCEKDDVTCPLYIQEHIVEGFAISLDKDRRVVLSPPGEWGYEGLEHFVGLDGKCYLTREEAEAALKEMEEGCNHA